MKEKRTPLRESLVAKRDANRNLRASLESLNGDIDSLVEANAEVESHLNGLLSQLDTLQEEKRVIADEVASFMSVIVELESDRDTLKSKLGAVEEKAVNLEAAKDEAERLLAEALVQIDALQDAAARREAAPVASESQEVVRTEA